MPQELLLTNLHASAQLQAPFVVTWAKGLVRDTGFSLGGKFGRHSDPNHQGFWRTGNQSSNRAG
jgi:hypothetical protein